MKKLKILIACEESQTVCKAFRELGFIAYSCDLVDCSGGHPEWHIKGDAIKEAYTGKYDLMVAHPPCTFLAVSGARWMFPTKGIVDPKRLEKAIKAKKFFLNLLNAPIKHIAIENPVPLKIVGLPDYDQVIQPFQYGDPFSKKTCLWLKNLPNLKPTKIIENHSPFLPSGTGRKNLKKVSFGACKTKKSIDRSKTFPGIAKAIADQWGNYILEKEQ